MKVSVIIPVRNDATGLATTIRAIARNACAPAELEFVVVDDASRAGLGLTSQRLGLNIKQVRSRRRLGVPRSRNLGASLASGDVLFMTDAHCTLPENWDELLADHLAPDRILAATIADPQSAFRGYGCSLVVPFMGTRWNKTPPGDGMRVQVASCAGTVIPRDLFMKLGGYDPGMLYYGAAEPEFSVRSWLGGAEILSIPDLVVLHRFKSKRERTLFLAKHRTFMVHNSLRFGLLYLSEPASLQMLRHFAMLFPRHFRHAVLLIQQSDIWARRAYLENALERDFPWLVSLFNISDQIGNAILM